MEGTESKAEGNVNEDTRVVVAIALSASIIAFGVGTAIGTIVLAMRDGASWSGVEVMLGAIGASLGVLCAVPVGLYAGFRIFDYLGT